MQSWRNSWFMTKFEIRRDGWGYLWSGLFFIYAAWMVIVLVQDIDSINKSDFTTSNLIVDFYFLGILATSGFLTMSRNYWGYWRTKSLTKKAGFLKSYPISASDTINGKLLHMTLRIIMQNGIFFIILILIPSPLKHMLTPVQFIEFILVWSGYSVVSGSIYVYMETSLREKQYLIGCITIALLIIAMIGLMWVFQIHIVKESIRLVQQWGVMSSMIFMISGVIALLFSRHKSIRQLHSRDFYV